MRLTNEYLLLLLAFVGDDGLTVTDLAARLGVSQREANWRLRKLQARGWAVKAGTRERRQGEHGQPPRIWRLAAPLAPDPAEETRLSA